MIVFPCKALSFYIRPDERTHTLSSNYLRSRNGIGQTRLCCLLHPSLLIFLAMEKTNKLIFVYAFVVVVVVLLVYFIIITILITVNPDFSDAKE